MSALVSVAELSALDPAAVRILDVRWSLSEPDGHAAYTEGHLPGAVWVDLEHELSAHGLPHEGRHPLRDLKTLQAAARRWGLDDGATVVAYDDANGLPAARAWWLLHRAGVDIRVLDGGLSAWIAAGLPVERGEVEPTPGTITLTAPAGGELTIDEAAAFPAHGVLIDARAPERYRGEVEPLDPVAGHIPGAVNVPMTALVDADGTVKTPAALRAVFAGVGVTEDVPVAVYCGSGVTAAHTALVLGEIGIRADVFAGSWSAWSNTPGRPVATGPSPGGAGD